MQWLREKWPAVLMLFVGELLMIWGAEGDVLAWLVLNAVAGLCVWEAKRDPRVQRWLTGRDA